MPCSRRKCPGCAGLVAKAYDAATGWLMTSWGADGTAVEYSRRSGGGVAFVTSVAGTTAYTCDAVGRWMRAETPCGAFGFGHCERNGKLAAVTNANGFVTAYAYDVMDRLASDGGVTYTYDAAGNRMTKSKPC